MKYKVNMWNNFSRVFELPSGYSTKFCFGDGQPTNFQMVDWFNPVPSIGQAGIDKETWEKEMGPIEETEVDLDELNEMLIPFLQGKNYVKAGKKYIILHSFGACSYFESAKDSEL